MQQQAEMDLEAVTKADLWLAAVDERLVEAVAGSGQVRDGSGAVTDQCLVKEERRREGGGTGGRMGEVQGRDVLSSKEWLLVCRDGEGKPVSRGGDSVVAVVERMKGAVVGEREQQQQQGGESDGVVEVVDRQDGSYVVRWSRGCAGSWLLSVTLRGTHVQGSPLSFHVFPPITRPFRTWGTKGSREG